MGKDAETREELLAEIKDLRARLAETEEVLLAAQKSRNNHVSKHAEDEIRWGKERNHELARADELLQFEKVEHRHSEEELGKTRDQLRDVSFRLLLAEETERKRIAQEIHDGIGQYWSTVKLRVERILSQIDKEIAMPLKDILPIIQVGLEETRRIQMNLRPASWTIWGFWPPSTGFAGNFKRPTLPPTWKRRSMSKRMIFPIL